MRLADVDLDTDHGCPFCGGTWKVILWRELRILCHSSPACRRFTQERLHPEPDVFLEAVAAAAN